MRPSIRLCIVLLSLGFAAAAACNKENNVVSGELCATGQYNCRGDQLQVCNASRTGWDDLQLCAAGACVQGESACRAPDAGGSGGSAGAAGSAQGGAAGAAGHTDAGVDAPVDGPVDAAPEADATVYETVPEYCNARAAAECSSAMLTACGVSKADCEAKRATKCIGEVPDGGTYRPAQGTACLAVVAQAWSNAVITAKEISDIRSVCDLVFGTSAEAGTQCQKHGQCNLDEGQLCIDYFVQPCGHSLCGEPVLLDAGENCLELNAVCPEAHFCNMQSGVCEPLAKKAQKCSVCPYPFRCEPQLKCADFGDAGKTCQDKGVNGSACLGSDDCASGMCFTATSDAGMKCAAEHAYHPADPECPFFGKN